MSGKSKQSRSTQEQSRANQHRVSDCLFEKTISFRLPHKRNDFLAVELITTEVEERLEPELSLTGEDLKHFDFAESLVDTVNANRKKEDKEETYSSHNLSLDTLKTYHPVFITSALSNQIINVLRKEHIQTENLERKSPEYGGGEVRFIDYLLIEVLKNAMDAVARRFYLRKHTDGSYSQSDFLLQTRGQYIQPTKIVRDKNTFYRIISKKTSRQRPQMRIHVSVKVLKNQLFIEVNDNGTGILQDKRSNFNLSDLRQNTDIGNGNGGAEMFGAEGQGMKIVKQHCTKMNVIPSISNRRDKKPGASFKLAFNPKCRYLKRAHAKSRVEISSIEMVTLKVNNEIYRLSSGWYYSGKSKAENLKAALTRLQNAIKDDQSLQNMAEQKLLEYTTDGKASILRSAQSCRLFNLFSKRYKNNTQTATNLRAEALQVLSNSQIVTCRGTSTASLAAKRR